jgi:large subunit ribosomal protein L4
LTNLQQTSSYWYGGETVEVPIRNMAGEEVGQIQLEDTVFAAPINRGLMHQALVRQLSNARTGTHKTKSRSEVRGGGRKPWRQKGTGRARHGSIRSPIWVGGGTAFGPTPRKYTKKMPKKMRRAALRSALSVKAGADEIVVLEQLSMDAPKTKGFMRALADLGLESESVLVILPEQDMAVEKSISNLPQAKSLLSGNLNIQDLLGHDKLLLPQASVDFIHDWLA